MVERKELTHNVNATVIGNPKKYQNGEATRNSPQKTMSEIEASAEPEDIIDGESTSILSGPIVPPSSSSTDPRTPRERPYNLKQAQESTRSFLAKALVGLLALTTGCSIATITFVDTAKNEEIKDTITLILTSQATLIGTALGFYFGKQD